MDACALYSGQFRPRRCGGEFVPTTLGLVIAVTLLVPSSQSGQQPQQEFAARVPRVVVDVVVRDHSGEIVRGLNLDAFTVFEDGRAQPIVDLQFVDGGTAPDTTGERATAHRDPSVVRSTVLDKVNSSARAVSAARVGAMVFVVDFEGLDWRSKERFGDAVARLLGQRDRLATPWAIYMVDQIGYLSEVAPLTTDVAQLMSAVDKIRATPLVRQSEKDRLIEAGAGQSQRRYDTFAERARAIRTFRRLAQFADSLAARDGRTALVWVSSGVQLMERAQIAAQGRSFATPWPQVLENQRDFHRAANTGRVSVYGVDPSRLIDLIPDTADVRHGPVDPGATSSPLQQMATLRPTLDAMRDSLREAAAATGGRAFVAWSNLQEVVEEIEDDAIGYYILTYRPPDPEGDGKYHEISVEVDRPEVQVRARKGYVNYSSDEQRRRQVTAALALPGTTTGLSVAAALHRSWLATGQAVVLAAATVTLEADEPVHTGADGEAIEAHAIVLTPTGNLAAEWSGYGRPEFVADDRRGPFSFTFARSFTLHPGSYSVRLAFRDPVTGRIGAVARPLELPSFSAGEWHVSDPLLLFIDREGNRRPAFGSSLAAGEHAVLVIEVYNGLAPRMTSNLVRIGPPNSARSASTPSMRPTDLVLDLVDSGIHRGLLELPELSEGEYELRLALSDSTVAKPLERELSFTVSGSL